MNRFSTCCLILLANFLSLKSLGQPGKNIVAPALPSYYLKSNDTERYAFFIYDVKRDNNLFKGKCKPATLSKQELIRIEELIKDKVTSYNKRSSGIIKKPLKYFKQFVTVINSNGEKEVWVNCCCMVMDYWKKQIQTSLDGGTCYFNLKVNLDKNIAYDFMVNGVA